MTVMPDPETYVITEDGATPMEEDEYEEEEDDDSQSAEEQPVLHYQHRLNPSWMTSQQIHWPLLHT